MLLVMYSIEFFICTGVSVISCVWCSKTSKFHILLMNFMFIFTMCANCFWHESSTIWGSRGYLGEMYVTEVREGTEWKVPSLLSFFVDSVTSVI